MVRVSDRAARKMRSLGQDSIRVFIQKGGCAEYKYGFAFPKNTDSIDEHKILEDNGVKVWVELADLDKLGDIELDHESSLMNEKFVVANNPYVIEKCGCGISFKGRND